MAVPPVTGLVGEAEQSSVGFSDLRTPPADMKSFSCGERGSPRCIWFIGWSRPLSWGQRLMEPK